MANSDKINILNEKKEKIKLGGGSERIQKQHESGKMTARERLDMLFDEGTFVETDAFVETRTVEFDMQKKNNMKIQKEGKKSIKKLEEQVKELQDKLSSETNSILTTVVAEHKGMTR